MRYDEAIAMNFGNFGMLGDIANIITRAKFYVNRLRPQWFGVLTPPNLSFSIHVLLRIACMAGRSYK